MIIIIMIIITREYLILLTILQFVPHDQLYLLQEIKVKQKSTSFI